MFRKSLLLIPVDFFESLESLCVTEELDSAVCWELAGLLDWEGFLFTDLGINITWVLATPRLKIWKQVVFVKHHVLAPAIWGHRVNVKNIIKHCQGH